MKGNEAAQAEKILSALREEVRCARYKNECLMKEEKEEEQGVGLYRTPCPLDGAK